MPALRYRRPARFLAAAGMVAVFASGIAAAADPAPPAPPTAAALKLPDGTIVLLSSAPGQADPPVDGVLLGGKEYEDLLAQADQARRLKDADRVLAPSSCHVDGKVTTVGNQAVAALTLTFRFQTPGPRAVVSLGCARGFPRSARFADGALPVLRADKDGLAVLVAGAGEFALTVELDVPVSARGPVGELGFDLGLPRAPITTLALAGPGPKVDEVSVGTRTPDRAKDVKRTVYPVGRLATSAGAALGPTDLLEVSWAAPNTPAPAADLTLTADAEVSVKVDEVQVETTAVIRLKGAAKEWKLVLPAGAEVAVDRSEVSAGAALAADLGFPLATPTLVPPTDPAKPVWTVRPPDGSAADWTLTVAARQPRPKPTEPKFSGPYPVGPFAVPAARQTGTIRVFAPSTVRIGFDHPPDVRQQDLPASADEELAAVFRYAEPAAKPGKTLPPALLRIEAARAVGFVRVEPDYRLSLSAVGPDPGAGVWRLSAKVRVIPIRSEVRQLVVELPPGWDRFEADPLDLVESVTEAEADGKKRYAVRLFTAERNPFEVTLTAQLPAAAGGHAASILMPAFPDAVEQSARLAVRVPDGLTVRGTATGRERGSLAEQVDMAAEGAGPAGAAGPGDGPMAGTAALEASFEAGVGRVDLAWRPYRPDLPVRVDADVVVDGRQLRVEQTFRFGPVEAADRPVGFRPAANPLVNLRFHPPLTRDPVGGDLTFRPQSGESEFTLRATYAIAVPGASGQDRVPVGLLWPDGATRAESRVRVWGDRVGPRVAGFEGPWGELPPSPAEGRDALPWLTLAGSGTGLPLTLLLDRGPAPLPAVTVGRALVEAWAGADGTGTRVRARFLLDRWPESGVLVTLPTGVVAVLKADGSEVTNPARVGAPAGSMAGDTVLIPMPASSGRPVVLDVGYAAPAGWTDRGHVTLTPPAMPGAVFETPVRWHVRLPTGVIPLFLGGDLSPMSHWVRQGVIASPAGCPSVAALEQWFETGRASDGVSHWYEEGETAGLAARQGTPGAIRVYQMPWVGWVAGCSLCVLVIGLGLTRLPAGVVGAAVGLVGVGAAVAGAVWPQPMSQVVAGGQPGAWALAVVLIGQAGLRWYHRRRVAYLPGFTRTRPESTSDPASHANGSERQSAGPLTRYPVPSDEAPAGGSSAGPLDSMSRPGGGSRA